MLFTVVIPSFNRASYLRSALDSVLAQTFTDFEIIVVDDGSTDETEALLESYGRSVRFLRQKNQGPGPARNLGISEARGEFVTFLDSDDFWFPWTLKKTHEALMLPSKPGIVIGKTFDFRTLDDLAGISESELDVSVYADYLAMSRRSHGDILTCTGVTVRRNELQRVGGFGNRNVNAEDLDLWMRLGVVSGIVMIQAPITCGYRRHPDSAIANLEKTFLGISQLISTEKSGSYPGGSQRRQERIETISRHVRPASLSLARGKHLKRAVSLYARSLEWNIQLGRWRYLFAFLASLLLNTFSAAIFPAKKRVRL
jgi:glycosyltransferase involved in cell wall biosynthesis